MTFPTQAPTSMSRRENREFFQANTYNHTVRRRVKTSQTTESITLNYVFRNYADVTDIVTHYKANVANSFAVNIYEDGTADSWTVYYAAPLDISTPRVKTWNVTVQLLRITT